MTSGTHAVPIMIPGTQFLDTERPCGAQDYLVTEDTMDRGLKEEGISV